MGFRPRRLPSMMHAGRRFVFLVFSAAIALVALALPQASAFAAFDESAASWTSPEARSARIAGLGRSSAPLPSGAKDGNAIEPSDGTTTETAPIRAHPTTGIFACLPL